MTDPDLSALLHPIASEDDLVARHVFHARLLGQELAVWRADDGFVNVWENRCVHRGVRLSSGMNDGAEVTCQYHGWRYSNRSGSCSHIPAHPAEAPSRAFCAPTFVGEHAYGLVWSGSPEVSKPPVVPRLVDDYLVLRSLPIRVPARSVLDGLPAYSFHPAGAFESDEAPLIATAVEAPMSVTVTATVGSAESSVVFFVQPADVGRSIIRPVLVPAPEPDRRIEVLRHHATQLEELRSDLEATAPHGTAVELPSLRAVINRAASRAQPAGAGRDAAQEVVVKRKWAAADRVAGFELVPTEGQLVSFQPGAHIDVHLGDGLVRQYSLTNGVHQTDCYRIGVKLEPDSRGGSRYLHEEVGEGDVLAISEPHNNFPLRRDASKTVLVAGGIGITPLLGMAQTLARQGLRWELQLFARSLEHVAFPELLEPISTGVTQHVGLSPDETLSALTGIFATHEHANHTYICGPGPMLESARTIAAAAGWPDDAIHFEYFENSEPIDDSSSFEVELARSERSITVRAGQTLLDALRQVGVAVSSSCEQGACGTCLVTVLHGDPDHQDVYLSHSERVRGDRMLSCVSRSISGHLTLDL